MKKEQFEEYVKPFLVLVIICIVVAFLLAFTNGRTAPIIEENARLEEARTRAYVLGGDENSGFVFEEILCDADALGIESAYREAGGRGYVIVAGYKGYGGTVTVTVGIDNDGTVVGLSADVSTETKGIGSRAGHTDYTDLYIGATGDVENIDTITNATRSSSAVKRGVGAALAAFEVLREQGA